MSALDAYAERLENILKLSEINEFRYLESQKQILNDCDPLVCANAEVPVNFSVKLFSE